MERSFSPEGASEAYRGLLAPLYQMENASIYVATIGGKMVACGIGMSHRIACLACLARAR
jgi:hypothetical protein